MKKAYLALALTGTLFLFGCATEQIGAPDGFDRWYTSYQTAMPSEKVSFKDLSLDTDFFEAYTVLFTDWTMHGKVSFNGFIDNPRNKELFFKNKGADLVVVCKKYSATNEYGTRYDQDFYLLKHNTDKKPIWEKNLSDFTFTTDDSICGEWSNLEYKIIIKKDKEKYYGFVENVLSKGDNAKNWQTNDLKFFFYVDKHDSSAYGGMYLYGDKSMSLGRFRIDEYGLLEADLASNNVANDFVYFSRIR